MALIPFDGKYRRVWMFPRNIRDIAPWKIYQAITVVMKFDDEDITDPAQQKYIYQMLEEAGVKKKGETRDANSGGTRTYLTQLQMLGLLYKNRDGKLRYTIAGQNLADDNNPLRILQIQLLRHQYPSAYGLGQNVRIDPRMKIKPFMFLLKLLQDPRIGAMTSEEMIVPVVYGHNNNCYELCVEKILKVRENDYDAAYVIDDPEHDLYTPRGSEGKALENIRSIANTAKNYLQAANLIKLLDERVARKEQYAFNEKYADLYQEMLNESDSFLSCSDSESIESFQRAYGRYDRTKDLRSDKEAEGMKNSPEVSFVQFRYVLNANNNLFLDDEKDFYDDMEKMGIKESIVAEAIAPYKAKRRSIDENNFLEFANSGGNMSEEFEKALTNLFISIGYDRSLWIGRKQSKNNWRGNFPDVFIRRTGSDNVGFADAKASSQYSLGHNDMVKMKDTYAGSNKELDSSSQLCFFIYVAGGFKGDINSAVSQLQKATGISVTAMDARTALRMLDLHDDGWSAHDLELRIFSKGGLITESEIEFLNMG